MESLPPPAPPQDASTSAVPPLPAEAEVAREEREKEMAHRTKVIQFLGRTTPIVLQNDNGPCPLLAICNVLSLKNSLNLSPDVSEVSQEKLLSLVAERLIDSNSNTDNKDTGYVENQQQNISDAIDLLPRLATGIDVNVKFRRIDDFEFTPECAIFDLLDIPLYHGWIVDPQDHDTADAIGSKSYNTLMGDLVSLETQIVENEHRKNPEDDSVDFVAATTAALGVPSPCLSRGQSFDESPRKARKGDLEEEAELSRALKLSEEQSNSVTDDVVAGVNLDEGVDTKKSELVTHLELVENNVTKETENATVLVLDESNSLTNPPANPVNVLVPQNSVSSVSTIGQESNFTQLACEESRKHGETEVKKTVSDAKANSSPLSFRQNSQSCSDSTQTDEHSPNEITTTSDVDALPNNEDDSKAGDSSVNLNAATIPYSSNRQIDKIEESEAFTSSVADGEPIYEGEECILEHYENREPVYEGEVVLAEQVGRDCTDNGDINSKDRISLRQGELIRNFMKTNASQLTIYGLFCLQDKVKERELCVFFRNNHFSTMFKYEGELYILATDQGYMNQPDLVWEKLNEVNGDTLYMTGSFKEFKMDENSNRTWDEQNAVATTADYLAAIDNTTQDHSSFNSDLQLAIALQQQEFEQQQQQQKPPRRNTQQAAISGNSGLITGPQVSRSNGKYTSSSSKQESSKSKEKCIVM